MADFKSSQRVRLWDGTNDIGFSSANPFFIQITDGTDVALVNGSGQLEVNVAQPVSIDDNGGSITVDATDLDIRNLSETTDHVLVFANTAADGTGTDLVPLVDAQGHLQVDILSGATGGTEYNEDDATPATIVGRAILMERDDALSTLTPAEGDWAALRSNARGALWVAIDDTDSVSIDDGGNSITVDGTVAATQSGTWNIDTVTTLTSITNDVNIADGGNSITVDATQLDVDDLNLTDDAVRVSGNSSANSETNPIYVKTVDTVVSGEEVHDYNTASAVASDATSNHDYTVAGTTFFLKSVIVAASAAAKYEIQVGPVASLATRAVVFTSASKPFEQVTFNPAIEVPSTSTGTVRVIRRNDDNQSQDMYTTIIGNDV